MAMEAYLHYLDQVLGVRSVILPDSESAPAASPQSVPIKEAGISVLFLAEKIWSRPADQLFQKMREAMKLSADSVRVMFLQNSTQADIQLQALASRCVVCFSKSIFDSLPADTSLKFHTHDPEELIKKADLKKTTWEDLKKVMKALETKP
ncbi:MAG: hypothetical protein ACAH59_04625 [Pseudobdellovibrionaceae bacterium]